MDSFENGRNTGTPDTGKVDTAPSMETPHIDDGEVARELAIRPYRSFFGELDDASSEKLNYLLRQLNPNAKLQPDEVIAKMRKIEARLGASHEPKIERIYRWVRLVNTNREMLLEAI